MESSPELEALNITENQGLEQNVSTEPGSEVNKSIISEFLEHESNSSSPGRPAGSSDVKSSSDIVVEESGSKTMPSGANNSNESVESSDIVSDSNQDRDLDKSEHHNDPQKTSSELDVESNDTEVQDKEEPKEEWMDILGSGHLMKKVLKAGEPDNRPNKSDICVLSFTGRLEDGTVVEKVDGIKVHLNDNEVIQGIDFALALMEKGEEAEVKVSPRFAYGSLGRKPDIPSGATLFYNVKLLDIQEDPPIHTLPANERIELGLRKKERGNWWYSRDEHSIAINCYRRALEFLDDSEIPEPYDKEVVKKIIEERLKTYNNLTASQMKIHAYDAALMSVNYVLTSQPKNVKALFRKSKILKEKGDITEAIKVVRLALSYDTDSQSLQQELSALLATQRKDNSKQRELYKKMMGSNSNQGKENENRNSKSTYSAIKWTSIFAFAVVVIAGSVAFKYKM